ncbi:MAG TPA: HAMP domain-containing sensor histidine kinase [Candidatus Lokiarchaeia archaeon]|nr:HAMP domain-containing sensor histidine kinase [Candidatus Lokiarchaeia archaeon]
MLISRVLPETVINLIKNLETKLIGVNSLEEAAQVFAEEFYKTFEESVVLVRLFITIPLGELPSVIQAFANNAAKNAQFSVPLPEDTMILTLFGTCGEEQSWNNRQNSKDHLGIPVTSETFVSAFPMMSALLEQLGFDLGWIRGEAEIVTKCIGSLSGTFFVEDAATTLDNNGRHVIPAQDFVANYGVHSVFGFGGGYLVAGKFVVAIVFCRDSFDQSNAIMFQELANVFKLHTYALVANKNQYFKERPFPLMQPPPREDWEQGEKLQKVGQAVEEENIRLLEEENTKLKEIDEMRVNFLSNAMHELKTPLIPILGGSEFLLRQYAAEMDPEAQKIVEMIHRGSKRLSSLVNNLLDFSKSEINNLQLTCEEVDFTKVLLEIISDLEFLLEPRKCSISTNIPGDIWISIDKLLIEQVVINLISNAVKNSPRGSRIQVNVVESPDFVLTSIIDPGVGLTSEEKAQLFSKFMKFNRDDLHLDIDRQGSGLGLFISKKIVQAHGGDLHAESKGRNRGSTFSFTLPKAKQ